MIPISLPFVSACLAEASHKDIQKTEKWRTEKCLPRFAADAAPRGAGRFAPGEHYFDDLRAQPNSIFLSLIFLSLLLLHGFHFKATNEFQRLSRFSLLDVQQRKRDGI
ncbi:hypothetical protein L0337_12865 [candidate division KSB1 bacterium]|nr:hypothetical protein [candidate division KSB1 bacterium]